MGFHILALLGILFISQNMAVASSGEGANVLTTMLQTSQTPSTVAKPVGAVPQGITEITVTKVPSVLRKGVMELVFTAQEGYGKGYAITRETVEGWIKQGLIEVGEAKTVEYPNGGGVRGFRVKVTPVKAPTTLQIIGKSAGKPLAVGAVRAVRDGVIVSGGQVLLDNYMHPDGKGGFNTDYSEADKVYWKGLHERLVKIAKGEIEPSFFENCFTYSKRYQNWSYSWCIGSFNKAENERYLTTHGYLEVGNSTKPTIEGITLIKSSQAGEAHNDRPDSERHRR